MSLKTCAAGCGSRKPPWGLSRGTAPRDWRPGVLLTEPLGDSRAPLEAAGRLPPVQPQFLNCLRQLDCELPEGSDPVVLLLYFLKYWTRSRCSINACDLFFSCKISLAIFLSSWFSKHGRRHFCVETCICSFALSLVSDPCHFYSL